MNAKDIEEALTKVYQIQELQRESSHALEKLRFQLQLRHALLGVGVEYSPNLVLIDAAHLARQGKAVKWGYKVANSIFGVIKPNGEQVMFKSPIHPVAHYNLI